VNEYISRKIFFPIIDWKNGYNTLHHLKELERSQWLSKIEIERIQGEKLKKLIEHSYNTVPYYKRIFDDNNLKPADIISSKDLVKLPPLTKEDIRNNLDDMLSQTHKKYAYPAATGGSTGNPLQFYRDNNSYGYANAVKWRFCRWAGLDLGTPYANFWGDHREVSNSKKFISKVRNFFMRNYLLLDSFAMSEDNMKEYVIKLRTFKPKVIRGYSSALYHFAEYIDSNNINDFSPLSVINTAEKLFPYQKDLIEKVFDCNVFSEYGSRESWLMAFECPTHSQLHVASEHVILELIKDGVSVKSGEFGEVYVTDLSNYAMPLIRYVNGDIATPGDKSCSCGRGLHSIKEVEGRITDMLQSTNGTFISAPGLTVAVKEFRNIQYIQFIQESRKLVVLNVVKYPEYSSKDSRSLVGKLQTFFGEDMKFDINFVDELERTPSGKIRFSMSKITHKL